MQPLRGDSNNIPPEGTNATDKESTPKARSPRSARAKDYLDRCFHQREAHLRLPPPSCFFAPETSKPTPDHIATFVVTQSAIHLTTALLHYQLLQRVPQAVRLQQPPPFEPAKPVTVAHSRGPRATDSTVPDNNNSLRQLPTSYPPRHQAPRLRCPGLPGTSPRCEAVKQCCHPSR